MFKLVLTFVICLGFQVPAQALPVLTAVSAGSAQLVIRGDVLDVYTTGDAAIDWQAFSIDAAESVNFIQQTGTSTVHNRVAGDLPSLIVGGLYSNGWVSLTNPTSIVISETGEIIVAALTLTTEGSIFIAESSTIAATGVRPGGVVSGGALNPKPGELLNGGVVLSPGEVNLLPGGDISIRAVPEPSIMWLMLIGGAALMFARRRHGPFGLVPG